eukprot:TRINITY_DN7151_c0_g1_i1.p1 TRINITY_DN7151_c0_g1~~TRINITY_DN7151_c0_g1_i1.p1  ORF type:complete len:228 (+),score=63.99 TRINITY_DN7151_c0_g1_i1:81-764(+)
MLGEYKPLAFVSSATLTVDAKGEAKETSHRPKPAGGVSRTVIEDEEDGDGELPDNRPLFDRLEESRRKEEVEKADKYNKIRPPAGLDEDDVQFLGDIEKRREALAAERRQADNKALQSFEAQQRRAAEERERQQQERLREKNSSDLRLAMSGQLPVTTGSALGGIGPSSTGKSDLPAVGFVKVKAKAKRPKEGPAQCGEKEKEKDKDRKRKAEGEAEGPPPTAKPSS